MIKRIIPRLDIKGPHVIKGIHLEGLRVLGKPEDFAQYYYEQGADELIYMDVVASLFGRNSLHETIARTAKHIFIPLTVGGGIRTLSDIRKVLRSGADKVSMNTAAIHNPSIISKAANMFGASTICISIEAIKENDGRYLVYTDNGREYTGVEAISWAREAEKLGAGEIMITSIDKEGTGEGFDVELTHAITKVVSIPVIACGGAGNMEDVAQVFLETQVSGAAIASLFHYEYISHHKFDRQYEEGNTEFLQSGRTYSKVSPCTIPQLKKYLIQKKIQSRI